MTLIDRPDTVDPTLALVIRLVDGLLTEPSRERLLPVVPAVRDTDTGDPRVPLRVARAIAHAAYAHGAAVPPLLAPPPPDGDPRGRPGGRGRGPRARFDLARARRRARRVLEVAMAELALLPRASADSAMAELVYMAVAAAREITHPTHPPPRIAAPAGT